MIWHWPQFTYAALCLFGLGAAIANHGRPREPYNCIYTIIASAITITLLYYGGFWAGATP